MKYNIFPENPNRLLNINNMGFSDEVNVTKFGPGQRNLYIIHYVTKGKGYFKGNLVTAGQGFLISPGTYEEYHADITFPWEFLWIVSSDPKMADFFPLYHADPKTQIFDYHDVSEAKQLANEIALRRNNIVCSYEMVELFLKLLNHHRKGEETRIKTNSEIYLDFFKNYVESNMHLPIKINEITAFLGVSQQYLYKICKTRLSVSPKQYIVDRKLFYAKKLLKESAMSITEIANSLGFEDVLTFSKFFSSHEKKSPQRFRNT